MANTKNNQKSSSTFSNILFVTFIVFIVLVFALFINIYPYLEIAYNAYENGIDTSRIDEELVPHMYDINGNLINMYYGYYEENSEGFVPTYSKVYTKIEELPDYVYNSFIAIEDENFYTNSGISLKRLIGASVNYLVYGDSSYGASTITQQLIKCATGDNSHTPERKCREIGQALSLNEKWSKKKIMESYLNLIYFGDNSYGIYEASMNYFAKTPNELNIAESATLAAIINKPDKTCPYKSDSAKQELLSRKNVVLNKMFELGFISEAEYLDAINFNVEFVDKNFDYKDKATWQYIPLAMAEAKKLVMNYYNLSSTDEAFDMILNSNTKIYTNLDTTLQQNCYNILKNTYDDEIEMGFVLTNRQGQVLTAITSKNDSSIDHVYTMLRQTGSAIKPLSVYGPAFDLGILTPSSIELDSEVFVGDWLVHNYDNLYHGYMTVRDAIAYSYNTIAVMALSKVGLQTSMEYMHNLRISSLSEKDLYYPALALGGLSQGISPFEMCQAYNTINNDGVFSKISFISKIEINDITIIPPKDEQAVFSASATAMLKDCLKAAVEYGTANQALNDSYTTYAKTGTTTNTLDLWTCGFTDEVTATLWAGYDIPKTIEIIPSGHLSSIWKELVQNYYLK